MRKKLAVIGNSLGLIIDRPILELLKIDRETEVEVTTDGSALIIQPVCEDRQTRVRKATENVLKRHDRTLKKLAE